MPEAETGLGTENLLIDKRNVGTGFKKHFFERSEDTKLTNK